MITLLNRRKRNTAAAVAKPNSIQEQEEAFQYASQSELVWWRFRQHRLAFASAILLVLVYFVAITAEFWMPYDPWQRFEGVQMAPPSKIHFTYEGQIRWPYVYAVERHTNLETFRRTYEEVDTVQYPIGLFVRGFPYKVLGLFETDIHLFGVSSGANVWLFGIDLLGRDVFSRTLYGARVSLFIGLVGVLLTFVFGVLLGGIAGYMGGFVDQLLERINEMLRSIPQLPLLMILATAIPKDWPILQTYFVMTVTLSVVGWVGLARVVRGRLLSMREEDYALAAKVSGCSDFRIIVRHLLPGFTSHLIVSITLSIPAMILNETALSFLGLGLYPPAISWGVLLQDTRNIAAIAHLPWLLIPAVAILIVVLLFNFVGDGLRDAADPFNI